MLVLEFGVRGRGDMRQLLRTMHPDIAVLTVLTPSYGNDTEGLRIQQEEMRLLCEGVGAQGHLLVEDEDRLLSETVRSSGVSFVSLATAQWSEKEREWLSVIGSGLHNGDNFKFSYVDQSLIGNPQLRDYH